MEGLINSIQHYSLHDGPGTRIVVFFQGCPLNCVWCSNPDTQSKAPFRIIMKDRCIGCNRCTKYECSECIACGKCAKDCPTGAIKIVGNYFTVENIIKEAKKDISFFQIDGGGITLSGGEPLLQWEFAGDVLEASKAEYIHTAVETSGFAPREHLEYVAKRCDLLLFDLKHIDSGQHEKYTGKPNNIILENIRYAADIAETFVRLPIIGGINDDEALAVKTAQFLQSTAVKRVDLLPYHLLGISKYDMLGKSYNCQGTIPSSDKLKTLANIYISNGISAQVF